MTSTRLRKKYSNYHYCIVRECKNTSIKTPEKLWIRVPSKTNMRNAWLRLAQRDPKSLSTVSQIFFCEDHFDLENDMENYMQYKIMGSVKRIQMKPGCVPLKFKSQNSKKQKHSLGPDQPEDAHKKEAKRLLEISTSSFLQELLNKDDVIPSCSSTLKQEVQHNTQFLDQAVQVQPMQEHVSCQVAPHYCYKVTQTRHIIHYRSKKVQCSIGMKDAATSPIQPIAQKSTATSTKASRRKSYTPHIFGMGTKCLQFSNYRTIPILRKMSIDIGGMRIKYKDREETFLEKHLVSKEPFGQFKAWFEEACTRKEILEPNAMCLATATKDGYPSARFVLCKGYGKDGFKFFTNYGSRKAKEMEENPNVAATFYWEILNRSVRIEGHVEKLSDDESTKYFHSRPVPSQIAASTSFQSTPIQSRDVLCEREKVLEAEYMIPEKEIPKPIFWGGYIIRPRAVEFWQGQRDRLHDRIKFRKPKDGEIPDNNLLHEGEDGWVFERLSP